MDRSPDYIRMCAQAEEIQGRWQRQYGDFFVGEDGRTRCWLSNEPDCVKFKKGYGIRSTEEGIIHVSKYIWLPRQNQLIEMAQVPGRRYDNVVQDFFDWTKLPYGKQAETPGRLFPSMEQIWLAFVMQQKYRKQWNGRRWIDMHQSAG
jgi:hypothetical protein